MKKFLAVTLTLLLMLTCFTGCFGGLSFSKLEKDPTAQVIASIEQTLDKLSPDELADFIGDEMEINFSMDWEETDVRYTQIIEEDHIYADLCADIDGEEIEAQLHITPDVITAALPSLADEVYGIDLNTVEEKAKKSAIFKYYPDGADLLAETAEAIKASFAAADEAEQEALLETDFAPFLQECTAEVLKGKIALNGEQVNTYAVRYEISDQQIKDLLKKGLAALSAADTAGNFGDISESFEAQKNNIAFSGELQFFLNPKSGDIMELKFNAEADESGNVYGISLDLELGEDVQKSDTASCVIEIYDGDGTVSELELLSEKESSKEGFSQTVTLTYEDGSEEYDLELTADYDLKTEEYELAADLNGEEYRMEGTLSLDIKNKSIRITADSIDFDGEDIRPNAVLTLTLSAENMPDVPAFKSILDITNDELYDLLL